MGGRSEQSRLPEVNRVYHVCPHVFPISRQRYQMSGGELPKCPRLNE